MVADGSLRPGDNRDMKSMNLVRCLGVFNSFERSFLPLGGVRGLKNELGFAPSDETVVAIDQRDSDWTPDMMARRCVDCAETEHGMGRSVVDDWKDAAVGDAGPTVVTGELGSAVCDGERRQTVPSPSAEAGGVSENDCSISEDAGKLAFSGRQQAPKVTLAGDAGKLVFGVVIDVSRENAYEKLDRVGEGNTESLSSCGAKRWASCSWCG